MRMVVEDHAAWSSRYLLDQRLVQAAWRSQMPPYCWGEIRTKQLLRQPVRQTRLKGSGFVSRPKGCSPCLYRVVRRSSSYCFTGLSFRFPEGGSSSEGKPSSRGPDPTKALLGTIRRKFELFAANQVTGHGRLLDTSNQNAVGESRRHRSPFDAWVTLAYWSPLALSSRRSTHKGKDRDAAGIAVGDRQKRFRRAGYRRAVHGGTDHPRQRDAYGNAT